MVDAWFDPMWAWIPGTLLGAIGGGVGGTLAGVFAPRGKFRSLVLGFFTAVIIVSVVLLAAGIMALVSGQPYAVWYGLGFPGLLCLIIFGVLRGVVAKQYTAAELRRAAAKDI